MHVSGFVRHGTARWVFFTLNTIRTDEYNVKVNPDGNSRSWYSYSE